MANLDAGKKTVYNACLHLHHYAASIFKNQASALLIIQKKLAKKLHNKFLKNWIDTQERCKKLKTLKTGHTENIYTMASLII